MTQVKPIPGFPDYFADTDGNIWSQKPIGNSHSKPDTPRLMKVCIDTHGYRAVTLWRNRKPHQRNNYRLVMLTFVGERPDGMWICHGEKGQLNDSLENLSYGTPKKNQCDDKLRDGTLSRGEKHYKSHLTEKDVKAIRNLKGIKTQDQLGKLFKTSAKNINQIQHRKSWAWLD
jgi:hypothetical protein